MRARIRCRTAIFFFFLCSPSFAAPNYRAPESWYLPIEDRPAGAPEEKNDAARSELMSQAWQSIESILQANAEALDKIGEGTPEEDSTPITGYERVPWRLYSIGTDLSISVAGIIGALALQGTPSISVGWLKESASKKVARSLPKPAMPEVEAAPPYSMMFHSHSTPAETAEQLEPAIQLAMASGKVKGEEKLREGLGKAAREFIELGEALEFLPEYRWYASRYRRDIWVDVTGGVGTTFGGNVKLRFEWMRLMPRGGAKTSLTKKPTATQKNFATFVKGLVEDAEEISASTFAGTQYLPSGLSFGIGVNGTGQFGIAKFKAGTAGYLSLLPRKLPAPRSPTRKHSDTPLYLIEDAPPEHHVTYAAEHGIPHHVERAGGLLRRVAFTLERPRFRRGMQRAAKLAFNLAKRADRIRVGKWRPYSLSIGFELDLGAAWKLNTVYSTMCIYFSVQRATLP